MIYDVSMPIHKDMQVYKNRQEKKPVFINAANHLDNQVHETKLEFNLHTGTHVDYPLHMIEDGKTSDSEVLETLLGKCKVIDFTDVSSSIGKEDLMKHTIEKNDFLLFKTKNSLTDDFLFDFIYLNEEGAQYLLDKEVRGVGIDGLGIERDQINHPTHKTLLGNDIVIIEGLRLKNIKEKSYQMICLPLSIKTVEASPARVILKELM